MAGAGRGWAHIHKAVHIPNTAQGIRCQGSRVCTSGAQVHTLSTEPTLQRSLGPTGTREPPPRVLLLGARESAVPAEPAGPDSSGRHCLRPALSSQLIDLAKGAAAHAGHGLKGVGGQLLGQGPRAACQGVLCEGGRGARAVLHKLLGNVEGHCDLAPMRHGMAHPGRPAPHRRRHRFRCSASSSGSTLGGRVQGSQHGMEDHPNATVLGTSKHWPRAGEIILCLLERNAQHLLHLSGCRSVSAMQMHPNASQSNLLWDLV